MANNKSNKKSGRKPILISEDAKIVNTGEPTSMSELAELMEQLPQAGMSATPAPFVSSPAPEVFNESEKEAVEEVQIIPDGLGSPVPAGATDAILNAVDKIQAVTDTITAGNTNSSDRPCCKGSPFFYHANCTDKHNDMISYHGIVYFPLSMPREEMIILLEEELSGKVRYKTKVDITAFNAL